MDHSHNHWFEPRRFGYGATPVRWQGWALSAIFVLVVGTIAFLIRFGTMAMWPGLLLIAVVTVAVVALSRAKTSGEWRWRWN